MTLAREILALLAPRNDKETDFPAIYIMLNTAPGGNYQARYNEAEIQRTLVELVAGGAVAEERNADQIVTYRITAAGRARLQERESE